MTDGGPLTACPLCDSEGFADQGAVENHILNKSDDTHAKASGFDLNDISSVREYLRRKSGEGEEGDPVLDAGPPEVTDPEPDRNRDRPGGEKIPDVQETGVPSCPQCRAGAGHVGDAPDGVPEDFMCTRCSDDLPDGRVWCFSWGDV